MRINGQDIIETKNEFTFHLREPFWSAWQKYGWENKEPGYGISVTLIQAAHKKKKKIVAVYNGVSYEISPVTINNYYKISTPKPVFEARGGIKLVVVPQSKFMAVKRFKAEEHERKEIKRSVLNQQKMLFVFMLMIMFPRAVHIIA